MSIPANDESLFSYLAEQLEPYLPAGNDGSHDLDHILRVWKNIQKIQLQEGGDLRRLAAAVLLHDCVSVEKNSPLRSQASRLAARRAEEILASLSWSSEDIQAVAHAIEAHSFSANIEPLTLEAKILQDADRLDAIGVLGAARCFYTSGRMKSKLYNSVDPLGNNRELNDSLFAIDHFQLKLFRLGEKFQTEEGSRLAKIRQERLRILFEQFLDEI